MNWYTNTVLALGSGTIAFGLIAVAVEINALRKAIEKK